MRHRHDGESRWQTATPPTLDKRASPRLYSSLARRKAATGYCIYRMQTDGSLGGDNSQREDGSER